MTTAEIRERTHILLDFDPPIASTSRVKLTFFQFINGSIALFGSSLSFSGFGADGISKGSGYSRVVIFTDIRIPGGFVVALCPLVFCSTDTFPYKPLRRFLSKRVITGPRRKSCWSRRETTVSRSFEVTSFRRIVYRVRGGT
jgi:hypothetical protein